VNVADRIRGIIAGPQGEAGSAPAPPPPAAPPDLSCLGGEWASCGGHSCFVVERRRDEDAQHGRERIGTLAERLERSLDETALVSGGTPARAPLLFLDLETTGLSGGAGTYAFLVGCAWFDGGRFATRQFLLTRFTDERPMLGAVAAELARAGAIVSFNGKSFDAPVLETRYLYHRLRWAGEALPHVDVLHPARRFWRSAAAPDAGCSLAALERAVLGARRSGDVSGFEVPERYFRFVRSGDARPLAAVLEHNRLDLLSLAGLTARLLELVRLGPDRARTAQEALALGHVYARAGDDARARGAYERALAMCRAPAAAFDRVKVEALRALALSCRRGRAFAEAAAWWERILDVRGCPPLVVREATEALAIHNEHRVRNLTAARSFALRALEGDVRPGQADAARHRLARIARKMREVGRLESEVGSLKWEV